MSGSLSSLLKNGATLQGAAGIAAIAKGDLLLLNAAGAVYPATTSDNAAVANQGAAVIAATTVAAHALTTYSRKEIFVNAADGCVFLAFAQLASDSGLTVTRYSAGGVALNSAVVDATASAKLNSPEIQQLSNGNLLVTWSTSTAALGVYFAIYDQFLNPVVAKTQVVASPLTVYYDAIPLTAGGFAVSYSLSGGQYLAIYFNTGAVSSAGALMTGTPTAGQAVKMAQLSSGNIAIAINSSIASQALGTAIFSVAGASVAAYAVRDAATSGGSIYPCISALTGFFACSICDGTNLAAYVMNNAGALQGGAFTVAESTVDNHNDKFSALMNDGAAFWLTHAVVAGPVGSVVYIPTSGTGFVTTTGVSAFAQHDAMLEKGNIIVQAGTSAFVIAMQSNGSAHQLSTTTMSGIAASLTIRPAGDFCLAVAALDSNAVLGVFKYMNTSMLGVSQSVVAAGNAGTLVQINEGPGGYACNPLAGTPSKAFDHTTSNLPGNRGTVLANSIHMKGIGPA